MTTPHAVYKTDLPNLVNRGKVRDMYALGDEMMIVASDRISAFDVVMNEPIPGKGIILSQMSRFWMETLDICKPNHMEYVVSDERVPAAYEQHVDQLRGRATVVRKVDILPVECVVRGYIIGSGWKDYQATGVVSGIELPPGLKKAQQLPEPIFTPSTKATVGHDEPVSFDGACEILAKHLSRQNSDHDPRELMERVRERSLTIYNTAAAFAAERGIILADTKFEFGLRDGELLLADEVLTPDSSRFWPRDQYEVGSDPPSYDKQFLRDYLSSVSWNKQPPPPALPEEITIRTREKYIEAYQQLTGAAPPV